MSLFAPLRSPRTFPDSQTDADARFGALLDQMVDGFFVSDAAGNYIDVNRAGCEMLGYSRAELLSMSIADVVADDETARILPEVQRLSANEAVRSEWRFCRKDGSVFIGEVVGRQLPDGRLQAILRDVSASRAVEDRLREAEHRYRVALSAAQLGTWRHDIATGIIALDARARACTGIDREAVPAPVVFAQFHPDDAARMRQAIAAALDPGSSGGMSANDFRIRTPDGALKCLRVHAHIRFAGEGADRAAVEVIGTMEDITARRSAQERLARLSRAYETRSEINKCVARAADEFELLAGTCRIIALHGGFRLVRVVPLGRAFSHGHTPIQQGSAVEAARRAAIAEWPGDAGVAARLCAALRRDGPYCARRLADDPLLAPQQAVCREFGIEAACLLPLFERDELVAAMACYAPDGEAFDADMLRLLGEMASDISFGLASIAETRQMHENELRFATIFRSSPDCILIIRMPDDCLVDANDAFLRAFGYAREEVVGHTVAQIELWQSEEARDAMLAILEREGRIRDVEAVWRRRSGELRDCVVSGEIMVLDRVRHLACVVTDVTERRAVDRLLYAREQEFRALAENSPDLITRYDRRARRLYANPAFLQRFGPSEKEILGRTPTECMPGSQLAASVEQAVEDVLETAQPTELDVSAVEGPAGRLVHRHIRVVPEFDAEGRVVSVLAVGRDVTRLKETKERLRQAQQQLRQLDARREHAREDERKRMAREIHDVLGQLLTALRLDLDMLGMEFGAEQPVLIERAAKAMRLVDETIAVVRSLATALRPPVLEMGIVSALEWLGREFPGHGGTQCEVMAREDEIALDADRATEVFRIAQESLTNVARYARARRASIELRRVGDDYELRVADDGVGFEPSAVGPKSLGLIGMRERAASLGGQFTVHSARGAGTQIVVRFPVIHSKEFT